MREKMETKGTMALINQRAYGIVFLLFNLLQKSSGTSGVKTHSVHILMSRKKKKTDSETENLNKLQIKRKLLHRSYISCKHESKR